MRTLNKGAFGMSLKRHHVRCPCHRAAPTPSQAPTLTPQTSPVTPALSL